MTTTTTMLISHAVNGAPGGAAGTKTGAFLRGSADSTSFSSALEGAMPQKTATAGGNGGRQDVADDGKALPADDAADKAATDKATTDDDTARADDDAAGVRETTAEAGASTDAADDTDAADETGLEPEPLVARDTAVDDMQTALVAGAVVTDAEAAPESSEEMLLAGPARPAVDAAKTVAQTMAGTTAGAKEQLTLAPRVVDSIDLLNPADADGGDLPDITILTMIWRRFAPAQNALRDSTLASGATAAPVSPVSGAANASVPGAVSPLPLLDVSAPVAQAEWAQNVGDRIQWMVGQRLQGAEIRLNPAHLGPMEVKVQMHNDQASIQFLASHQAVRDALEAALPRLREMLGSQGVDLVNVDISDRSSGGEQQSADGNGTGPAAAPVAAAGGDLGEEADVRQWTTPVTASGSVDLFV